MRAPIRTRARHPARHALPADGQALLLISALNVTRAGALPRVPYRVKLASLVLIRVKRAQPVVPTGEYLHIVAR